MSGNPYGLFGNPEVIASFAPQLKKLANRLDGRAAQLQRRVDRMGFEGPKAFRFRERMHDARTSARDIAGGISELADGFTAASRHEAERIREWQLAQERLEQGPRP